MDSHDESLRRRTKELNLISYNTVRVHDSAWYCLTASQFYLHQLRMISIKLLKDWGMWGFSAVNFRCLIVKPTFFYVNGVPVQEVCNIGCFCNLHCFTIGVSLCGLLLNNCSIFVKSKKNFTTISFMTLDPGIAVIKIIMLLMSLRFAVKYQPPLLKSWCIHFR